MFGWFKKKEVKGEDRKIFAIIKYKEIVTDAWSCDRVVKNKMVYSDEELKVNLFKLCGSKDIEDVAYMVMR